MRFLSEVDNLDKIRDGDLYSKLSIYEENIEDGAGYVWFTSGLLIQWGKAIVTPSAANTVASLSVNYPISYDTVPDMKIVPQVQYPDLITSSVGMGTTIEAGRTAFLIYMTRTNTASTTFQWQSVGYKAITVG